MLNMNTARRVVAARIPPLHSPLQLLGTLARLFKEWEDRARQRRTLAEMPDHMLKDLGISRSDAQYEAEKPFWRP